MIKIMIIRITTATIMIIITTLILLIILITGIFILIQNLKSCHKKKNENKNLFYILNLIYFNSIYFINH